jgi:hypothetical protein
LTVKALVNFLIEGKNIIGTKIAKIKEISVNYDRDG